MVSCGLACPGGGGAGVSGCEFRGSGWGWDRRCQDPLRPGNKGGPYHMGGGGGVATRNTGPYIHTHIHYLVAVGILHQRLFGHILQVRFHDISWMKGSGIKIIISGPLCLCPWVDEHWKMFQSRTSEPTSFM